MATGWCPNCGKAFNFDAFVADVQTVSEDATLLAPTDSEKLVIVDTTSGDVVVTMPNPAACLGKKISLSKKVSANSATILPYGSGKLIWDDEYESMDLNVGETLSFIATASGWLILSGV